MKEEKLRIREVNIVLNDAQYAYIADGLEHGEQVVTTNLSTVTDGAPLRLNRASENVPAQGMQTGFTGNPR